MRRRGSGLIMTAAVAGGAAHMGAKSAQQGQAAAQEQQAMQQQSAQQQAAQQDLAAQQQDLIATQKEMLAAQAASTGPAEVDTADKIKQLKDLGELKTAGVLTDAEFEVQKAKILSG